MLNLGDVLSFVAALGGAALSTWGLLVAANLVFDRRVTVAQGALTNSPWKCFWAGLVWLAVLGTGAVVLLGLPTPLLKFAGAALLVLVMSWMTLGTAGIVQVAAKRLKELDPEMSHYATISRGAMFVVLPGFVPVLGWIGIAPVILVLGLGAGMKAIMHRSPVPISAPEVV
jgi:hypothetical protein